MKKHIPNSITCCNLISGCIAIGFAFAGKIEVALLFIIIGAVFDFFDGMVARLLNVSSPIGKELDSLADVITFGLAPSTIIFSMLHVMSYPVFLEPLRDYLPYVAFIMAAFSAFPLSEATNDASTWALIAGSPTAEYSSFAPPLMLYTMSTCSPLL